jgi:hypothetical protein
MVCKARIAVLGLAAVVAFGGSQPAHAAEKSSPRDAYAGTHRYHADGATGWVRIRRARGDAYAVTLEVASKECNGKVSGSAVLKADHLAFVSTGLNDAGKPCKATIRLKNGHPKVAEENCLIYHGDGCAFDSYP